MTKILNSAEFDELVLKAEGRVLVDFFAVWCGPCRMLAPTIDEIATEFEGKAGVYKVDTDASPDVAMRYSINAVPTLIMFENGKAVRKITGAGSKDSIVKMLTD